MEQGENQQQTQPTCDAGSGNRTRDTAVGGERSHHCAIPAPHVHEGNKVLNGKLHFQKFADTVVQCVSTGNVLPEFFFPALCTCVKSFWDDGLVQEFFSYAYELAGYFFSKSPPPPPPPPKKSKMVGP